MKGAVIEHYCVGMVFGQLKPVLECTGEFIRHGCCNYALEPKEISMNGFASDYLEQNYFQRKG